jgi:dTDP-4-amino-4,6-dideoxygalactose transaminase
MYYLLLPDLERRSAFIARLKEQGVHSVFHYVPLHSAPHGRKVGRVSGSMRNTDDLSDRLVRLPLWVGLEEVQQQVIRAVSEALVALR